MQILPIYQGMRFDENGFLKERETNTNMWLPGVNSLFLPGADMGWRSQSDIITK
jgi:hypothetical protein